jgi:hypothetical protein
MSEREWHWFSFCGLAVLAVLTAVCVVYGSHGGSFFFGLLVTLFGYGLYYDRPKLPGEDDGEEA